jgi:hypothetical protein
LFVPPFDGVLTPGPSSFVNDQKISSIKAKKKYLAGKLKFVLDKREER